MSSNLIGHPSFGSSSNGKTAAFGSAYRWVQLPGSRPFHRRVAKRLKASGSDPDIGGSNPSAPAKVSGPFV